MTGFKVWVSGETLNAADLNDYVMEQSVVIWPTAGTREGDSDYTDSLVEGNLCYIQGDGLYYYTGSAWSQIATKAYVDTAAGSEARKALLLSFMESN